LLPEIIFGECYPGALVFLGGSESPASPYRLAPPMQVFLNLFGFISGSMNVTPLELTVLSDI